MRIKLLFLIIMLGIVIVFYLSWLPHPKLNEYWFIPNWLGRWTDTDANENIRTAVPFVFLGILVGFWLAATDKIWHWWLFSWIIFVIVAGIAEIGQLFLPERHCDLSDVAWAGAGTIVGMIIIKILFQLKAKLGWNK